MLGVRRLSQLTDTIVTTTRRCVSTIFPNTKKLVVVAQYPADTVDFNFLPADYSLQLVALDKIQSKDEFIDAVKKIPKDSVIVNLIDNCEDSANEATDKYISTSEAAWLDSNKRQPKVLQPEKKDLSKLTYYKIGGLTAIDWYTRLELAYTGASAHNFATKKTDLKVRGVPTPRHVVIRDRKFSGWEIQFRGEENRTDSSAKTGIFRGRKSFPLKFPVIVKPLKDYGGSTFIQEKMKCESMKELQERIENFPVADMLVEEFIVGEEYAVFIYQNVSKNAAKLSSLKQDLLEESNSQDTRFRRLASRIRKEKGLDLNKRKEVYQKVIQANRLVNKKLAPWAPTSTQASCRLTDPIQVILPSHDSFQHEEMKWRLVNSVYEKMSSGKNNKEYMMQYRMIPQALFSTGVQRYTQKTVRQHITKLFEAVLDGSLKHPFEQTVRDAYLHTAIQKAAKKAWRILKHDGYFRYDLRVIEKQKVPGVTEDWIRNKIKSKEEIHKYSTQELMSFFPRYKFEVYVIDANPYCSLYGIPANYDEADSMLSETPNLSHKEFTVDMIRTAIFRELTRRVGQVKQEQARNHLSEIKQMVLRKLL
ncbi:type 11 methyltransferase [Perkinsela sp. CCAP 1560/4]|nr:type 11 methyltransferase [Perkinsela sp. CCAP 1560/4]|eukprot:KNH05405.1 type 11 methyltransferase [Perkinsela sp. CCAP 1560/4]